MTASRVALVEIRMRPAPFLPEADLRARVAAIGQKLTSRPRWEFEVSGIP